MHINNILSIFLLYRYAVPHPNALINHYSSQAHYCPVLAFHPVVRFWRILPPFAYSQLHRPAVLKFQWPLLHSQRIANLMLPRQQPTSTIFLAVSSIFASIFITIVTIVAIRASNFFLFALSVHALPTLDLHALFPLLPECVSTRPCLRRSGLLAPTC